MNIVEEPLDELYFQWLYRQVGKGGNNRNKTTWKPLRQLYQKEFVWLTPNDDNRVADGVDLRWEFVNYSQLSEVDARWMGMGCSVLEMLVGLSRRLAFQTSQKPEHWFWVLMANLGLSHYCDSNYDGSFADIDEVLEALIYRNYSPSGRGGLFPLRHPDEDQRGVEIWYQMAAYLYEQEI